MVPLLRYPRGVSFLRAAAEAGSRTVDPRSETAFGGGLLGRVPVAGGAAGSFGRAPEGVLQLRIRARAVLGFSGGCGGGCGPVFGGRRGGEAGVRFRKGSRSAASWGAGIGGGGRGRRAIRNLRPGGGTALYDAIYFTAQKLSKEQPPEEFRRAIVVLSDGDDNQSRWTRDQALEMAQKADVVIYTISTNSTGLEASGDKVLRYFAQETGGQTFTPFKVSDLDQSFENIANELRHQYIIVYRPEPFKADGLYHNVDVKVKNRKDLVVRARHGYYAPLALP